MTSSPTRRLLRDMGGGPHGRSSIGATTVILHRHVPDIDPVPRTRDAGATVLGEPRTSSTTTVRHRRGSLGLPVEPAHEIRDVSMEELQAAMRADQE